MSDLIVVGYDSPAEADAARAELLAAAKDFACEIEDALFVTADAHGALRLRQMADVWAIGASGGGLWGLLAGMLFLTPQRDGRTDAAASGGPSDYGLDAAFMAEVAGMLSPGRAAFCLLIHAAPSQAMMDRLGSTGAEVVRTSLDHRAEDSLRHVFSRAPARFVPAGSAKHG